MTRAPLTGAVAVAAAFAAVAGAVAAGATGCGRPPGFPARPGGTTPSDPSRVDHAEGFFAGAGDVQLFEQSWRPPGAPPRAVVVLVHGLLDHSSRYAAVATCLADHGFAVYAFDLRGHAHSAGPRVWVDRFDDYLADLDRFVERVRAREPGKPVFVFGHSMGGAIVTLWAVTRKPAVAGVTLSAAALQVGVSGLKVLGTKVIAGLAPRAGVFSLDLRDFSRDPAVVKEALDDPWVYHHGAPARTARELLRAIRRIEAAEEDVTVPLLLMHGTADKVTPPAGSKALYERARTADKTLKLYDGLYHDLFHEPEKATVVRDWLDWLEKRAPPLPVATPAVSLPVVTTPP
jgi:acylglycerol lipase